MAVKNRFPKTFKELLGSEPYMEDYLDSNAQLPNWLWLRLAYWFDLSVCVGLDSMGQQQYDHEDMVRVVSMIARQIDECGFLVDDQDISDALRSAVVNILERERYDYFLLLDYRALEAKSIVEAVQAEIRHEQGKEDYQP